MPLEKISARVDPAVWKELRDLARESGVPVSKLLTEAIREFIRRRRRQAQLNAHLDTSINENDDLGGRLAD